MKNVHTGLRSPLGKSRGLGSAKHGVGHWWWQRVSALALIPLSAWFVFSLLSVMLSPEVTVVAGWFTSPVNALVMILLLGAAFFHACLGLQVVIEDYVKPPFMKYALLIGNTLFCTLLATAGILSVLRLHFLDVLGGL